MRFIGLFLSLVLIILSSYEGTSLTMSIEKSSQIAVECSFEKKQSEKLVDETRLLPTEMSTVLLQDESIHLFQDTFYVLAPTDPLFRPPINA